MEPADRYQEQELRVRDEAIGLDGLIQGYIPVQAEGWVKGHPFYFRARYGNWIFVVSFDAAIDPAALSEGSTEKGFFTDNGLRGYFLCGEYAYERANGPGSYMPYSVAEQIIRESAARFTTAYDGV
jgi:hypothetical protein